MSTMDSSMVNVALPVLMRTFHSSLALTEWVVLVYLLTITTLLVFWGRLCRIIGCGRVYSGGMLVFTLGSLLCGMAPGVSTLILFRCIQGLGASMMMATGPALIKSIFPAERLGRGLGMIGVATSLGLMAGPVVSGLLIHRLHWRAIFWVTVPLGLFFYLLGRRVFGRLEAETCSQGGFSLYRLLQRDNVDLAGAVLWATVVTLTILFLTRVTDLCCSSNGPGAFVFAGFLVMLAAGWIFFLWYEKRQQDPFLPLMLLRERFFLMAVLSSMLSFAVLFIVIILTPFYLDRISGLTPDRIGYVMMALPLCVFIVSPVAGRLHDRLGARVVATSGLVCCLISLFWLTTLTVESSPFSVALRLALIGFGQAMFLSPNSAAALAGVSEELAGVTASMLATARNFGMLSGAALAGLIFALHFSWATGGLDMKDFSPALAPEFMLSLKRTFQYGLVISSAAIMTSLLRQGTGVRGEG
jgi:EmrB/QacA subfamily drug resistance transporter